MKHKNSLSLIVATKDRCPEIRRMLRSLEAGTRIPEDIVIVDGGLQAVESVTRDFPQLNIRYLKVFPPSATTQRNIGVANASPKTTLIGFLDDDIVLQPDALEKMLEFWDRADGTLGGTAFNMLNHPKAQARVIKAMNVVEVLGLYSRRPGIVMPSGFQTMIGKVSDSVRVMWLPGGAVVFRRGVMTEFSFDQWYSGYSYLEDLDFSYKVGKEYDLSVVPDAGYFHYPGSSGRGSGIEFGRREVLNRVHFVHKYHELSLASCGLALLGRAFISFCRAVRSLESYSWQRVGGNILGFIYLFGRWCRTAIK